MIQAIIKKGKVLGVEVPIPTVSKNAVLIKVVNSCISAGTETVDIKKTSGSLIKRAIDQPQNVRKVIDMAKSESISNVYLKVKTKIASSVATGYSLSGVVIEVGEGVTHLKAGDRVAAGGAGLANHAEYVDVSENLVVKIPPHLDFVKASTVTLGAIAMQAVRRASLNLGEFAVVFGVGMLGLLAVQLLKSCGVRVAAVDLDEDRLKIAKELSAEITVNPANEESIEKICEWSNGFGADAVIFAAATKSSEPLSKAFKMCRKKGKVVLLGVSGMNIQREDIYPKELDFLVSTSYGPGRYDPNYEDKSLDYPYSYVRWTENRNMIEYLRLVAGGHIELDNLISKIYPIEKVEEAFDSLSDKEKKLLMVILDYGGSKIQEPTTNNDYGRKLIIDNSAIKKGNLNVALIGSGNFATGVHLPNILKLSDCYNLHAVMNRTGLKGKDVATQFGAKYVTTSFGDILNDEYVDLLMITARHDSHAEFTLKALEAGKNVFVEKPLAINHAELEKIAAFFNNSNKNPVLMVGFNRRFSKYARLLKTHTDERINPLYIHYRMNAGYIPLDHWVHESGGRIVGECCHIIDLITFLTGCRIVSINCEELSPRTEYYSSGDNKSIILKYEDGSVATINYFAVGNKKYPKEYMEVHFDQKTIVLDDYKSMTVYGIKIDRLTSRGSQKGHLEELSRLHETLSGKNPKWPIELWDMIQTTEVAIWLEN